MYKQFICARTKLSPPDGFRSKTYLDWTIWVSPGLPVSEIRDGDGRVLGLLLGWFIKDDEFISSDSAIEIAAAPSRSRNPFNSLCGRFVVFCEYDGNPSLLTDAGALFPVVYDQSREIIASSSCMIPEVTAENRDPATIADLDLLTERGWYPFGLTAHAGIRRLLPNRALNLASFAATRTWPLEDEDDFRKHHGESDETLLQRLCESLSGRVKTVTAAQPTIMHLTGGWDTRMMLSAARESIGEIDFRTYRTGGSGGKLDQQLARLLSDRFKLKHEFVDLLPVSEAERRDWMWRTGYCLNDHVIGLSTTECSVAQAGEVTLAGAAGEVARAFYWNSDDIGKSPPTPEILLQRLGFKNTEILNDEARRWLEGLPKGSACWVYDLAYIELRLGCWAGVAMTGHDIPLPSISPFNSVDTFQTMMSFSDRYRADGGLCKDIAKRLWPELLSIPINRAAGLRKLLFVRQELSATMPPGLKEMLKKYLRR